MAPFNLLESHSHRAHLQYVTAGCVVHVDALHESNAVESVFTLLKDKIGCITLSSFISTDICHF